jgi:hypothetical protein
MRLLKQLMYGGLFLIILAFIAWWIFGLIYNPIPTCTDNTQNQGETGVDCGGPCMSCEVKSLKPITVSNKYVVPISGGVSVAVELVNPNTDWGVSSFAYTINLKDQFNNVVYTTTGNSFIYPGELKYIVIPRISATSTSVAGADILVQNPQWISGSTFTKPNIEIQDTRTEYIQGIIVSAKLNNRDTQAFKNVVISALVFNHAGTLIGASNTTVDSLNAFDSASTQVIFSKDLDLYQPVINATISFSQNLKQGDTGNDVINLQQVLTEQGLYTSAISGFFDTDTQSALGVFQTKNNVTSTGELDDATRTVLNTMLQSNTPQQNTQTKDTSVDATKTKIFISAHR